MVERWIFGMVIAAAVALAGCAPQPPKPVAEAPYYTPEAPLPIPSAEEQISSRPPGLPQDPKMEGDVLIGMLVPLTGPQGNIGEQLRDAALMGLYDKQQALTRMERTRNPRLIIRDTGTTPEQIKKSTQELIDAGVDIILGPLMAKEVSIAGALTLKAQIPLIAFSNNEDVAKAGIYVFGFSPKEQIRRVADYALKAQIQHYAALAPQSDYGRKVVQDLSAQVAAQGLSLQPVEFFTDGLSPTPMALNRVTDAVVDWGATRKAVFLPMTGKPLADTALQIMTTKKIEPGFIKLLGTGLWDDAEITAIPALQGAWFATSDPLQTAKFSKRFEATYGHASQRLASLAYDAVALVATLALENGEKAFAPKILHDAEGFNGPANGVFRLLPNGRVERALAVVEIGNGGFHIIDPAPTHF